MQEAERREIARELHDELGQSLTGIKLLLEMARRATDTPPLLEPPADGVPAGTGPTHDAAGVGCTNGSNTHTASAMLADAQALVGALLGQVRALSLQLRPAMLDDLGLLPALLWHLERYTQSTSVEVTFQHTGLDRRFPPDVETAAYRIVQEALTNVARHAGVPAAKVRLWCEDERLMLRIEDDGAGFDPESALAAGATAGLAGMRERPALLGGELTIDSAPGKGCRLTASLPI